MSGRSRVERREAARLERARRHRIARTLATEHDGMVTRAMLLAEGLTRGQIQGEIDRGAWTPHGWHSLSITAQEPTERGRWWLALWESGRRSFLDGPTALLAQGLKGWSERRLHVSVPNNATVRPCEGVSHHLLRDIGPVIDVGLRRTRPEVAVIRAAQWAASDRQAATILAMTVQQRLVAPAAVLDRWTAVRYSARRAVLDEVVRDVCDGAQSLSELDFAAACRRRGLPEPARQVVRTGPNGRVYLDVYWDDLGVHVEIQGAHHYQGTAGIDDALRFNELGIADRRMTTLQLPVLGLRTCPDRFFDQIERALTAARRRAG